jgi:hypothetical protein
MDHRQIVVAAAIKTSPRKKNKIKRAEEEEEEARSIYLSRRLLPLLLPSVPILSRSFNYQSNHLVAVGDKSLRPERLTVSSSYEPSAPPLPPTRLFPPSYNKDLH